jgi:hypothetical protein
MIFMECWNASNLPIERISSSLVLNTGGGERRAARKGNALLDLKVDCVEAILEVYVFQSFEL